MDARKLIQTLCSVSEKAANVARLIRKDAELLELLVQEKEEEQANPRFVQDFKTLADVLIQETIRKDVGDLVSIFFIKILENPCKRRTLMRKLCNLN